MTTQEVGETNTLGEVSWSVVGNTLKFDNGNGITRTYTRKIAQASDLQGTWITDLTSLGHVGHSHVNFLYCMFLGFSLA